jgi:hypothetical protein
VSLSVIPFARDGLLVFSGPGGVAGGSPRGATTHVSYRTALRRSPFPNQVFFLFPNKLSFPA